MINWKGGQGGTRTTIWGGEDRKEEKEEGWLIEREEMEERGKRNKENSLGKRRQKRRKEEAWLIEREEMEERGRRKEEQGEQFGEEKTEKMKWEVMIN